MSTDHTPTENTPERVLASAHSASYHGENPAPCKQPGWHEEEAGRLLAHQPLRDALTRGLAGSGVVCICPPVDVESCDFTACLFCHPATPPAPALTAARLAVVVDEHWLKCDGPTWSCTCGEWSMPTLGARREDLGKHLFPFSLHCANAIFDAITEATR